MTIKKLSKLARIECGLEEFLAGKVVAFVAVMPQGRDVYGLGIAEANVAGYTPVPLGHCWGDSYKEMDAHADELNVELGLDDDIAARIIASSMCPRARRVEPPQPEGEADPMRGRRMDSADLDEEDEDDGR